MMETRVSPAKWPVYHEPESKADRGRLNRCSRDEVGQIIPVT